ncbi:MAG: hypothetical protein WCV67_10695 [Victivallaceae bacterium]|jgi:hypothetical protein
MADAKKSGNVFGEVVGCLILVIAVLVVLFWFLLKPKLEEAGYSFSGISEKASNIKESVSETFSNATDKYRDTKNKVKDKTDDAKDKIDDTVDGMKKNNSSKIPLFE